MRILFLNYKREDLNLKIIPWPNKDNNNYLFRIIQYIPTWWDNYEDDVELGKEHPNTNEDLPGTYNMDNINVLDYNMVTNKFDNTNNLSLKNRDQSAVQYNDVFASHNGHHLLSHSRKEKLLWNLSYRYFRVFDS